MAAEPLSESVERARAFADAHSQSVADPGGFGAGDAMDGEWRSARPVAFAAIDPERGGVQGAAVISRRQSVGPGSEYDLRDGAERDQYEPECAVSLARGRDTVVLGPD